MLSSEPNPPRNVLHHSLSLHEVATRTCVQNLLPEILRVFRSRSVGAQTRAALCAIKCECARGSPSALASAGARTWEG